MEAGALLLFGVIAAGAIGAFSSLARLGGWLRGEGFWPVCKATLVGMPLPICSCGIVPIAASLLKRGAGKGPTVAFIVSTPETGVDSLAVTYAFFDPLMAALRPLAALVTALTAGLLAGGKWGWHQSGDSAPQSDAGGRKADESSNTAAQNLHAEPDDAQAWHEVLAQGDGSQHHEHKHDHEHDHEHEHGHSHGSGLHHDHGHGHGHTHAHAQHDSQNAKGGAARRVLLESLDLLEDIGPSMAFGLLLAGFIEALMPAGFVEQYLGKGLWPMLIMLLLGLPSFVCASMSTPIVAALVAKGLSAGGALVYLLTGPATNVATIIMLRKLVGTRATVLTVVSIAVVALAFGMVADTLYDFFGLQFAAHIGNNAEDAHGLFATFFAIFAGLALGYSCLRRYGLVKSLKVLVAEG